MKEMNVPGVDIDHRSISDKLPIKLTGPVISMMLISLYIVLWL